MLEDQNFTYRLPKRFKVDNIIARGQNTSHLHKLIFIGINCCQIFGGKIWNRIAYLLVLLHKDLDQLI